MIQQVNLYTEEMRPSTDWLSAEKSIVAFVLLLSGFLLLSLFKHIEFKNLDYEVNKLEEKSESLKAEAAQLRSRPQAAVKADIEQEIAQLRAAIHNRQQIESLLSGQNLGNSEGFSAFVAAISTAVPADLALQKFSVLQSGKLASFKGKSKDPKHIPLFFDKLQKQVPFEKTHFGQLSIRQVGSVHEFSIGPKVDPASELVQQ